MFRTLTAAVLSATIALGTFGARPAQALDEKDLLGLLAAGAAVVILKKELDDRKEERRAAQVQRKQTPRYDDQWSSRHRVLPSECSFRLEGRDGRLRNVIGPRCLQRNGVNLSKLPDTCLREVRTTRGWRDAYGARCMEREGWRLEGRRNARAQSHEPRRDDWNRDRRTLPGQCSFRLEDRDGRMRDVLGARCLESNGVSLARLPDSCLREVRTTQGWREAYTVQCIEREGWRLDGVRRIGN